MRKLNLRRVSLEIANPTQPCTTLRLHQETAPVERGPRRGRGRGARRPLRGRRFLPVLQCSALRLGPSRVGLGSGSELRP